MGRPRVQSAAPSAQSLGAGRSPASTEKLGDVSRLLRARSFWVEGDSKAAQRVRANLQLGTVPLDKEAVAWISDGRVPEDKLGISLDDGAALELRLERRLAPLGIIGGRIVAGRRQGGLRLRLKRQRSPGDSSEAEASEQCLIHGTSRAALLKKLSAL